MPGKKSWMNTLFSATSTRESNNGRFSKRQLKAAGDCQRDLVCPWQFKGKEQRQFKHLNVLHVQCETVGVKGASSEQPEGNTSKNFSLDNFSIWIKSDQVGSSCGIKLIPIGTNWLHFGIGLNPLHWLLSETTLGRHTYFINLEVWWADDSRMRRCVHFGHTHTHEVERWEFRLI